MALTKAMAEAAGDAGWCIHLGATSNDIVDSAVALQIRDSIILQQVTMKKLLTTMCDLAERERDTVMLRSYTWTSGGTNYLRPESSCMGR